MVDAWRGQLPAPVLINRIIGLFPIRACLLLAVAIPPIYLLSVMYYGAINLPYWDHVAIAPEIIKWFDGTLTFHDLLQTHSQSRPLFPRLIYIGSAAVTDWDVSVEYVWLYATTIGSLAALLVALVKVSGSRKTAIVTALMISVMFCSPAGWANHTWSVMLILTLSYLASIVALLIVSFRPLSWTINVVAALLSWVATYSICQGLFLFPTFILLHQIIARQITPNRWSLFWLANMALCFALFLPGVPPGIGRPSVSAMIDFCLVYTGAPISYLIWFPRLGANELPYFVRLSEACGAIVLAITTTTAWHARSSISNPNTRIFLSLTVFSAACMVVTAWGRADVGAYVGGTSRYTIYSALGLFGLIFYWTPRLATNRTAAAALCAFLALSLVNYFRAIPAYASSRAMNEWIAKSYAPDGADTEFDLKTYPDKDYFHKVKRDLARLKIGPYRSLVKH